MSDISKSKQNRQAKTKRRGKGPLKLIATARHKATRQKRANRHRDARKAAGTWRYMGRGLRKKAQLYETAKAAMSS